MRFEWDAKKDRANLAKHRVDFAIAALVFSDPHLVLREDRIDEGGERRWHALGLPAGVEPLLLVVHVYREAKDGEEIIRIVSARKAGERERRRYFE
jgi:uncharacterized DUF497 family protein